MGGELGVGRWGVVVGGVLWGKPAGAQQQLPLPCSHAVTLAVGTLSTVARSTTAHGQPTHLRTQPHRRLERACATADDFQRHFLRERLDRRRLHEQLSELRGNIRVFVRVRPLMAATAAAAAGGSAVSCPHPGTVVLQAAAKRQHEFEFDAALGGASTQVGGCRCSGVGMGRGWGWGGRRTYAVELGLLLLLLTGRCC